MSLSFDDEKKLGKAQTKVATKDNSEKETKVFMKKVEKMKEDFIDCKRKTKCDDVLRLNR